MENAGSLSIIKSGLLDTIRDKGRLGFRSVGIPVNGVMDSSAYFIAILEGEPRRFEPRPHLEAIRQK